MIMRLLNNIIEKRKGDTCDNYPFNDPNQSSAKEDELNLSDNITCWKGKIFLSSVWQEMKFLFFVQFI